MEMPLDARITLEYMKVFTKFFESSNDDERLRLVTATLQFPGNILLNLHELIDKEIILPVTLPEVFIREMKPWEKHKDKWGNIPLKDFIELIQKEYETQSFPDGLTIHEEEVEDIR